ncbi:MAG: polysaccharide biosynthesis protein [Desulfobacterales bacterium]|nr:polysaccharide biosynthesis protein [Desulfobacterales bacterium]
MKNIVFRKNFFIFFSIDIFLVILSFYVSYMIRFDFNIPPQVILSIRQMIPVILIGKIISFFYFDLYRGMWRYTSLSDLINIIKASSTSTFIIFSYVLFRHSVYGFSKSVFLIDLCLTVLSISGLRLGVRFYYEHIKGDRYNNAYDFFNISKKKKIGIKNLLIIGAGDCGEKIFREIRNNSRLKYDIVGFLDDDPDKKGKKIHGVPIVNDVANIKFAIKKFNAHEALIAIPSASSNQMRNVVKHCEESGIEFKTIPGIGELINGNVTVKAIRNVDYRDLLGREVVKLDEEMIVDYIKNQVILVTGAGGSIGSELCRQICRFNPKIIILYERAESPLYELDIELKHTFPTVKVVPYLADIQDKIEVEKAFYAFKPTTIFHAAAYKHVPMMERYPWKAIKTNVLGSLNLIEAAKKIEVDRFVFVSTDKAVRPANVMGATKRVAEIMVQNQNCDSECKTKFMTVRFGNVIGSCGSVIPLFKKQIEKGGPLTVTHPEVTRYFMTIPEASQLILQTGAMGNGGEIFILEMGTPIKIDNMARDLIRLSGFEPDVDIKIKYVGMRPGEKLYEELITEGEGIVPTNHEKIMVLKGTEYCINSLNGDIDKLALFAQEQDEENIRSLLQKIVPEYHPAIN